jgi:kinetochore protein NDC80
MAAQRLIPHIENMSQEFARGNESNVQKLESLEAKNRALRR